MLATFEAILPIFLLIVAGNVLRRLPIIDANAWPGLEQLGYWFLYPTLLFTTIVNADFGDLSLDRLLLALVLGVGGMILFTLMLWPSLDRRAIVVRSEYSSVFQTAIRWNGFMAFAIAEKLFPVEGPAVVALVMAVIIAPINVASVAVVARFGAHEPSWASVGRAILTNPLIIAVVAAVALRQLPLEIYPPIGQTLDLVGRASLGMGLIAIGAGLKPGRLATAKGVVWLPIAIKLVLFPAVLIAIAWSLGIRGPELSYLALCGAVPTAMNGYLLARQLGGDADLYAVITTLQTILSFLTIPAVLTAAAYVAGG